MSSGGDEEGDSFSRWPQSTRETKFAQLVGKYADPTEEPDHKRQKAAALYFGSLDPQLQEQLTHIWYFSSSSLCLSFL